MQKALEEAQRMRAPTADLVATDPTVGITNVMAWIEALLTWAQVQVGQLDPGIAKSPTNSDDFMFHHAWDAHGNVVIEKHHLLVLAEQLSERLFNMQQRCVQLGIEERRVRIAEAQSVLLGRALGEAVERVGLTPKQRVELAAALEDTLQRMRTNPPLLEAA